MLTRVLLLLAFGIFIVSCIDKMHPNKLSTDTDWNNEVIYHVMPRSFYDSNGDRHGDLQGFIQKLEYLKELGITAILFTPLYESGFYHNYFPTSYYEIDPEYGTKQDYLNFVIEVHDRGMKFIMDMETQYVQDGHIWFDSTFSNPGTIYDDFIFYSDSLNALPAQLFFGIGTPLFDYVAWPGDTAFNIATLDLTHPTVLQWQKEFYAFWTDPNGDGNLYDGVDGFRIDHIMDDLDNKGIWTNLYTDFWTPIFDSCRSINPDLFIVGEQANWGEYGDEIIHKTSADGAFNFPLKFNLRNTEHGPEMSSDASELVWSIDPERFHAIVDSCLLKFGSDHYFINFIENHDTDRFASVVKSDERILKLAAVLLATLPGTPSIYYGQELGLTGTIGDWGSDANHIPVREAFPWEPDVNAKGIAAFYKNTGPWWEQSVYNSENLNELALSSQRNDSSSLWNHYREILNLRKQYACLRSRNYAHETYSIQNLIVYTRSIQNESITVIANAGPSDISLPSELQDVIVKGKILKSSSPLDPSQALKLDSYSYLVVNN